MGRRKKNKRETKTLKLTMKEYYEICKATHTVEWALMDDPKFRRWYIRNFPNSWLARKYKKYGMKKLKSPLAKKYGVR